ncbi:MAG: hypothetical protein QMD46_14180, partial [Methanomicrobiales archaeon]|nr:hypothetical protein [Methanomicrobiales archaeon]
VNTLKNLCRYYKIGEPDPTKYNWGTGNINKVRLNKSHWIEHARRKIPLEDIKEYAKKHRINIADVQREQIELENERREKYKV